MKRFIIFSGKRHLRELGAADVTAFLNHLVLERQVAAATQNQALAALLFLCKEVLAETLPWLDGLEHDWRPARLPTVLTVSEARQLLAHPGGTKWLMASLLHGAEYYEKKSPESRMDPLRGPRYWLLGICKGFESGKFSGWKIQHATRTKRNPHNFPSPPARPLACCTRSPRKRGEGAV